MACTCIDETRFRIFLVKCKKRFVDRSDDEFWRLEKYMEYLEQLLRKLKTEHADKIDSDVLNQYGKDVSFLRNILDSEKQATPAEQLQSIQSIKVPIPSLNESNAELQSKNKSENNDGGISLKSVKMFHSARKVKDLRRELLGDDNEESKNVESSGLRFRKPIESSEKDNTNIDAVLKHHYEVQEDLADQFLTMTMHLKHNVTAAGQVVKEDRRIIERVHTTAEKNLSQLEIESERLADFVNASCDLWLWFLLLIVFITFICMVLFMRLFPKRY